MFQDILSQVLEHIEGAQACTLMGFDGIPIAVVVRPDVPRENVMAMAVELANILGRAHRATAAAELGTLRELGVRSDQYAAVAHVILDEYALVLAVAPNADMERSARMLRLIAPRVEHQM